MVPFNLSDSNEKPRNASWKYKLTLLGLFALAYCFLYVFPNIHAFDRSRQLPLLMIDRSVPFLPWTFVVYLSEYLLIITILFLINDFNRFTSFARLAFGALFIAGPIFILAPTSYPRPVYPVENNIMVKSAMNLVGIVDAPTNCFPSLHVAITSIAVYALRFLKPKVWFFFVLWGVAILVSTMTTKQHYFIDIAGGLLVTLIVVILEKWLFKNKSTDQNHKAVSYDNLNRLTQPLERKYY